MKERPILFSSSMVRAILDGKKTQTRRVIKLRNGKLAEDEDIPAEWPNGEREAHVMDFSRSFPYWEKLECPYGKPGDRLWVRETCWIDGVTNHIHYKATDMQIAPKLTPSIFMPRWASRITLEITGVRVERLQDISNKDAQAEGTSCYVCGRRMDGMSEDDCHCYHSKATSEDFGMLWEQINGPGSWDLNPWVWVIEFRRV